MAAYISAAPSLPHYHPLQKGHTVGMGLLYEEAPPWDGANIQHPNTAGQEGTDHSGACCTISCNGCRQAAKSARENQPCCCGLKPLTISIFVLFYIGSILLVGLGIHYWDQQTVVQPQMTPFWPPPPPDTAGWSYSYSAEDGPLSWSTLINPVTGALAFPFCGATSQSPIDLPDPSVWSAQAQPGQFWTANSSYTAALHSISTQLGHPGFQVGPALNSSQPTEYATVGGQQYTFRELRFHGPSEHTINGQRLPLELHAVHQSVNAAGPNDGLLIFALLFNATAAHNPALDAFWAEIYRQVDALPGVLVSGLLQQQMGPYVSYTGSETSPPCSPDVKWLVSLASEGVNPMQLLAFTYALSGIQNYRVVQPLGGRQLQYVSPS